jgi:rare lipoprotein A
MMRPRDSVLVLCLTAVACSARTPPVAEPAADAAPGWSETGVASWYGEPFHGRRTASGEIYDMEEMTAAHQWLPFQTIVQVENLDNGRRTEVRITDRGPFVDDRIIDLSRAGARSLGMLGPGTANARITILEMAGDPSCLELQVGAFRERSNAAALRRELEQAGLEAREQPGTDGLRRVIAGPFGTLASAEAARRQFGGLLFPCPTDPPIR